MDEKYIPLLKHLSEELDNMYYEILNARKGCNDDVQDMKLGKAMTAIDSAECLLSDVQGGRS